MKKDISKDLSMLNQSFNQTNVDPGLIANQLSDLKELLDDPSEDMTGWEYEFIESILIQHEQKIELSPRQLEKIDDIWTKYCDV